MATGAGVIQCQRCQIYLITDFPQNITSRYHHHHHCHRHILILLFIIIIFGVMFKSDCTNKSGEEKSCVFSYSARLLKFLKDSQIFQEVQGFPRSPCGFISFSKQFENIPITLLKHLECLDQQIRFGMCANGNHQHV